MEEKREEVLASAKEAKGHPERLVKWDPEKMREELGLPQEEEYPLEKDYLSQILQKIKLECGTNFRIQVSEVTEVTSID